MCRGCREVVKTGWQVVRPWTHYLPNCQYKKWHLVGFSYPHLYMEIPWQVLGTKWKHCRNCPLHALTLTKWEEAIQSMLQTLCKRGTNNLELVNVKFRLTCKNGSLQNEFIGTAVYCTIVKVLIGCKGKSPWMETLRKLNHITPIHASLLRINLLVCLRWKTWWSQNYVTKVHSTLSNFITIFVI